MGWTYQQPPGWKATRRRILRRDRGICHVCGRPDADEVDHVRPVTQGGGHDDANLAAIHATPCHADKTERERQAGVARRARRAPTPRRRQHPSTSGHRDTPGG